MAALRSKVGCFIVVVVVIVVVLEAAWHAVIPGYFAGGVPYCSKGCHQNPVISPEKISGPLWCTGCHGFGVKSEILPGIPFVRSAKLEELVHRCGESVMCHDVSGSSFHEAHIVKAWEQKHVAVRCTDCHIGAYHGRHTTPPPDSVCVMCHDPIKAHKGVFVGPARSKCLSCHGDKPVTPASAYMRATYGGAVTLAAAIGFKDGCMSCHKPVTPAHYVHEEKKVSCMKCHASEKPHGYMVSGAICSTCHKLSSTPWHAVFRTAPECGKCHGGWEPGTMLFIHGRGCTGCHGTSVVSLNPVQYVAGFGLHYYHAKSLASCSECHKVDVKTHAEFIASGKTMGESECSKCHGMAASAPAHRAHFGKTYMGETLLCITCHSFAKGAPVKPVSLTCVKCHAVSETPMHELMPSDAKCTVCHEGWVYGKLYMYGKTCTGCHPAAAAKQAVSVGLHASHVKLFSCSVCHPMEKTHKEVFEATKAMGSKLCYECHTETGEVKTSVLLQYGLGPVSIPSWHVELAKLGKGECLQCHYQWSLPPGITLPTYLQSSSG